MSANLQVPTVRRFATLAGGLECAGAEPFVVPRADREDFLGVHLPHLILTTLTGNARALFGYDAAGALVETTTEAVLEAWRHGALELNLIDAPLSDLAGKVPARTLELLGGDTVAPVLSRAGTYTALHVDRPELGGGWMFLASGTKEWLLVDPECLSALYDREGGRLRDLPIDELTAVVPREMLRESSLGPGDFLFFPPGWMHRVRTHTDSVGVGGYCLREQDRPRAEQLAADLGPGGAFSFWT